MHRFEHDAADHVGAGVDVAPQQPFDHAHRVTLVDQLICASGARR